MIMEIPIEEKLTIEDDLMAKGYTRIMMNQIKYKQVFTRANGKMVKSMEKASTNIEMEMFMKDHGKMESDMENTARIPTTTSHQRNILVIGKMIRSMVME